MHFLMRDWSAGALSSSNVEARLTGRRDKSTKIGVGIWGGQGAVIFEVCV